MTEENNLPSGLTFQSAQVRAFPFPSLLVLGLYRCDICRFASGGQQNVDTLADGTFLPTETTLDSQALQVVRYGLPIVLKI